LATFLFGTRGASAVLPSRRIRAPTARTATDRGDQVSRSPSLRASALIARALDRVTRPPILTVFALLQACLLGIVVFGHLASRADPAPGNGAPGTGDFAAFFTGAVLVRDGRGADLYDFAAQKAFQDALLGEGRAEWQPYINPPALAMALAPISALGYSASYLVFTGALALILLSALVYLMGATPRLSRSFLTQATTVLLTMGYLPVALTTFGGQNTALTLALLAGTFAAVRRRHTMVAGVLLGLLTFKPQYTILLGLALLLRREWRVVSVAAAVGLLHYAIAAAVCGVQWPVDFWTALAVHGPLEMADNAPWHFSLPAAAQRYLPGRVTWMATGLGIAGVVALVLASSRRMSITSARFPAFFGMLVAGTLLASPHLQYYEAGILALAALLAVESILERGSDPSVPVRVLLAGGYLGFPAWQLSEAVGFQPLLVMLLAVFVWSWGLVIGRDAGQEEGS